MDEDLAYCLDRFIDEQIQLIDDRIEEIKRQEMIECDKIEQVQRAYEKKKASTKDKGSHERDQELVDRFIRDLRACNNVSDGKTILDDEQGLNTLQAELRIKIGACITYIDRLRNLSFRLPNTKKFLEVCSDCNDYFRRNDLFDENFSSLCELIKQSDLNTIVRKVQRWWTETYGSKIADLNHRNQKIHPAITETGYATITSTSRIMNTCKSLLASRKIIIDKSSKLGIIQDFVHQLRSFDENERNKSDAATLIDRLNKQTIDQAVTYARQWLQQRDERRNEKEEENPYGKQLEELKAEFGRRCIAQEAKKLALGATLRRLAAGSKEDQHFDQKLKETALKQKQDNQDGLVIISGDVKNPEAEELPFVIQLIVDETNMNQWMVNDDNLREQFSAALCDALEIPVENIRVDQVDAEKGLVYLWVKPPYGQKVIDSLNGNAADAAVRMAAVRKCCLDLHANVESITLGDFDLDVENKLMDPRWNKKYIWSDQKPNDGNCWNESIDRGGKPYFCPSGWMRYGIKVAKDDTEFDARWGSWHIAYHGTRGEHASSILTSGLRVSTNGCFYEEGIPRVYVSPSIEYSAHPRYALPWKKTQKNGQSIWYQLVFQCRVNPKSIDSVSPETLLVEEYKSSIIVDPNFDNNELEWIILGKKGLQCIKDDIICYGIMMRTSSIDPSTLTPSKWWRYSMHSDIYKK